MYVLFDLPYYKISEGDKLLRIMRCALDVENEVLVVYDEVEDCIFTNTESKGLDEDINNLLQFQGFKNRDCGALTVYKVLDKVGK